MYMYKYLYASLCNFFHCKISIPFNQSLRLNGIFLEVPLLTNDNKRYYELEVRLKGQDFSNKLVVGKILNEKKSSLEVLVM